MYAADADQWSGNPWVSIGNVQITGKQRGNLSDLVQKGLIRLDESHGDRYIVFTEAGREYAKANGIDPTYWN
jgi:hypothetical protein